MEDVLNYPIVVVEDDPDTRQLLERQLTQAGYRVSAARDGREALEPISAMGTGIVLADWNMPEMDGLELCQTVRELEQMRALGTIYFILLTAHVGKDDTIRGLEAGANDYLTKPYHIGELLARIIVGNRILRLQEELLQKTVEYQKANSKLALLSRRLEELASTDALTNLATRRAVFERFAEVWELSERHQLPLACIMLDVDRFKTINDTYGHDTGDHVLKHVAETIRTAARRPDLCGRIGGEEFVVLCPATPLDGGVALAERIRENLAASQVTTDQHTVSVTLSCGVAERAPGMARPDDLMRLADSALYAAKTSGRNQTYTADQQGHHAVAPTSTTSA